MVVTQALLKLTGQRAEEEELGFFRVFATIYPPEQTSDGFDYCRVSIPILFEDEQRIFGADAEQARALAASFARDLLRGSNIDVAGEVELQA